MPTEDSQPETSFLYELARQGETSRLVGHLKRAENPVVRRRAAELLGEFDDVPEEHRRDEITGGLIAAVEGDDDDSVRAVAIDSLYRHGTDSLERLIESLSEGTALETEQGLTELLVEWLESEYPSFRLVAVTALGELGDEQIVPALVETLADPDPRVRARALRACGALGGDNCVPHVAARLDDEYTSVQEAAATALGAIGTEQALEALVPAVTSAKTASVRRIAVEELGQAESLQPLVVLIKALEDSSDAVSKAAMLSLFQLVSRAPAERTTRIRETIAEQLHSLDDSLVVPPLLDICRETPRTVVHWHAVWFLGRVPSEPREAVVDRLLEALDSDDDSVARVAVSSLEQIADDDVEKRLRIFTQNDDASEEAIARAESLLEKLRPNSASEAVTNSIDVTYVRDPTDYTDSHRDDDQDQNQTRDTS